MRKIVLKPRSQGKAVEAEEQEDRLKCGHRPSKTCGVHACCACYIKGLLHRHYGHAGHEDHTGGITNMAKKLAVKKAAKETKEPRVTAASILVEQFGLKAVKSNDELIKMVKKETGSTKFDERQLAWYKSQYRGGKMKGQNGKAGHPIAQAGGLKKSVKPRARNAKEEEPIEE